MKTSRNGINLIKEFEGYSATAYLCPAGVWTIGYGTTEGVASGMRISEEQALRMLANDLNKFERAVSRAIIPAIPNQNQFDAMVSLCYNIGERAFTNSSVARNFKGGRLEAASNSFMLWNKITVRGKLVVSNGLVRRRGRERDLFLRDIAGPNMLIRETSAGSVLVPEESVVPVAPKSLVTSREIIAGGTLTTGGVAEIVSNIDTNDASDVKETVQDLRYEAGHTSFAQTYHLAEISAVIVLIIGIFIIWKRFRDRREGVR